MTNKQLFEKVNDTTYIIKDCSEIINIVDTAYNLLQTSDSEFESVTSKELYNSMLARKVTDEFFKLNIDISNTNFINIILNVKSNELIIVAGIMKINDERKYVSGVLYK